MANSSSSVPTFEGNRSAAEGGRSDRAAGALDNYAKSSGNRSARWAARGFLWEFSNIARLRKCGRVPVTPSGLVGVRASGESVGFAGLATCGSVWACPVCNARIQSVRRLEIGVALANVHANGGGAAFGAFTVRHHSGQPLAGLLSGLTYGIARIPQDKTVRALRSEMGHLGRIQALEVTVGKNGWHPHRHPLVLFSSPPSAERLAELHAAEFRAFRAGIVRKGLSAPLDAAQVLLPVRPDSDTLGAYFTKSGYSHNGVAFELTASQSKAARRSTSRTPWELLDAARLLGDADEFDLWSEYERGTKGKRSIMFSRGLRDLVGLGASATDEEIAEAEIGDKHDTGFYVSDWAPIRREAALGAGLLNAVTPAGNWQAGRDFCVAHGIPVEEVN